MTKEEIINALSPLREQRKAEHYRLVQVYTEKIRAFMDDKCNGLPYSVQAKDYADTEQFSVRVWIDSHSYDYDICHYLDRHCKSVTTVSWPHCQLDIRDHVSVVMCSIAGKIADNLAVLHSDLESVDTAVYDDLNSRICPLLNALADLEKAEQAAQRNAAERETMAKIVAGSEIVTDWREVWDWKNNCPGTEMITLSAVKIMPKTIILRNADGSREERMKIADLVDRVVSGEWKFR